MSEIMIQRRVFVSGRVQGVYFRQSTQQEARKYPGLKGFVRNLPDGRVEAVFAGSELAVHSMISFCQQGPPAALVTDLEIVEEKFDLSWNQASGFSIRM
ncbi:MAG: hypothetical protein A2070_05435 [Bdellovibrionales bacterium GWC1_52_8]|nr:MAG: hypothetical protein A2X97_11175 [Bdellovibrionales bacterium GWA1_52_35]OFZ42309.1 MAG: hypothetical protein A2070_05435 [Bdellovibrionales bacterium GWC1_52_8]